MSFSGHDVVTAARDGSAWFDVTRIPGGPASRLLTEVQRDLIQKVMLRDKELLATSYVIPVATILSTSVATQARTGVTLPPAFLYIRARTSSTSDLVTTQPTEPLDDLDMITPDRAAPQWGRAWFVENGVAYFTGSAFDWGSVQAVEVTYVPTPSDVYDRTTDTSILPDQARGAMIAALMFRFAKRVNGQPVSLTEPDPSAAIQLDINSFSADATKAEQIFLSSVTNQRRKGSRHTLRGER